MSKLQTRISWLAQLVAAVILLQTLFFKFTASDESVYIFSKLGVEPTGRIGSGVMELITGLLLLIPRTAWAGALLGLGIMAGAILSHFTVLGIEVQGDGGQLFAYALITFACCATVLVLRRREVPLLNLR
jgi:uncharacterized membrane protein YphA (DoxX/SURF4 family)